MSPERTLERMRSTGIDRDGLIGVTSRGEWRAASVQGDPLTECWLARGVANRGRLGLGEGEPRDDVVRDELLSSSERVHSEVVGTVVAETATSPVGTGRVERGVRRGGAGVRGRWRAAEGEPIGRGRAGRTRSASKFKLETSDSRS